MSLINREELLKSFGLSEKTRKYGGNHSGYDTRMLYEIQNTIEDAVEVDAIPVDWIEKYIEEMDEIGFCPEAMHVSTMMGRWREEQKGSVT